MSEEPEVESTHTASQTHDLAKEIQSALKETEICYDVWDTIESVKSKNPAEAPYRFKVEGEEGLFYWLQLTPTEE